MTAASSAVPPSIAFPARGIRRRADSATLLALALASLVFCTLSVYLAYRSESDLEADATTHFLIARYAPHQPVNWVGVWGRPLCTAFYAITAHIGTPDQGRFATRLLSLLLAMGVAAATYAIAKRQGHRRPALAVILLLAQPLFFLHSFSELTEIPFALVLMLGFLAYQRRQWLLMCLAVGILPLGRPEGLGFIMMAGAALVLHRRARWLPVLILPFMLWNWAGWYITSDHTGTTALGWIFNPDWWKWVVRNNPYSYQSMYGRGYLFSYVARLPVLTSPFFFPFMLVGTGIAVVFARRLLSPSPGTPGEGQAGGFPLQSEISNLKSEIPDSPDPRLNPHHLERCEALIAFIPWLILAVHSVLWWKGKMGSSGDLRYLLIVGPFFALLGARGWEWAWQRFQWRIPHTIAGFCALAPISANFTHGQRVVPFPLYADGWVAQQAAAWYQADLQIRKDFPKIMPTPPGVPYAMDVDTNDGKKFVPVCKANVITPQDGAVMIWDPVFGSANSNADMCVDEQLIHEHGWVHYKHFQLYDTYCDVYLSPKTITGEETRLRYKGDWESQDAAQLLMPRIGRIALDRIHEKRNKPRAEAESDAPGSSPDRTTPP